ncbi:MAG TPA: J domain-containing protein [Acetobacteraceae bacterium]|nr:J domain-containing protein [Acetobacteraceae bacterium]
MTRRATRPRAFAPDPAAPGRLCDMGDCPRPGEYRAPRSRQTLTDYYWFCLDHVRAYNASWDYYKGMTPGEIEAQLRADTAWQRPTWPLGRLGGQYFDEEMLRDPLHILASGRARRSPAGEDAPAELRQPLATLGLEWPVTIDEVKARYKELAKRHHPDANGGDRTAEERLKTINLAYASVRNVLTARPATQNPMAEAG